MAMGKKTLYLDKDLCSRLEKALKRVDGDLSVSSVLNQYLQHVTPFYEQMAQGVELADPRLFLQGVMEANQTSQDAMNALYRVVLGVDTEQDHQLLNKHFPVPPKTLSND